MTREEAKADIYVGESTGVAWTNAEEVIDQIYNYFEPRITELEYTIKQDNNFIASQLHKIEELQLTINKMKEEN